MAGSKGGPKIDEQWFIEKLAERNESKASLARHLGKNPSYTTLLLKGRRRFQMDVAESVAAFLRVPVEEVLRHAGVRLRQSPGGDGPALCKLVGTVDENMRVQSEVQGGDVPGNPGLPLDTVAIRVQTAGTSADMMDGWLLYFQPSQGMDPALVTRLCIAELMDGDRIIGSLRRGYSLGTYNVVVPFVGMIENAQIVNATQIILIKP